MLEDYKKGRKEKAFKDLIALLRDIYSKHTNPDVLVAISCTYKHLLRPDFALFSEGKFARLHFTRHMYTELSPCALVCMYV